MTPKLFTPDGMGEYLRHRLGKPIHVERITQFPRGSSRETWFIEIRENAAAPLQMLVFRLDFETGKVIVTELEQEYFIY